MLVNHAIKECKHKNISTYHSKLSEISLWCPFAPYQKSSQRMGFIDIILCNIIRVNFRILNFMLTFVVFSLLHRCSCVKLWFFRHPNDIYYGASQDRFAEAFLVEVKTRAENADEPLQKINGAHLIEANFQMCCTGGHITFLQCYLPEKEVSNVFPSKEIIC